MRLTLSLAGLGVFILLLLTACKQEEPPPPPNSGFVAVNQAYLKNFGTPPQGKAGEAFARVGYLPLQEAPEKVRAFPLFLFTDKEQLRQILTRLISGELVLTQESGLYNPFPPDLEVSVPAQVTPTLTLSLKTGQSWSDDDQAAAGRALAETALQSEVVERVIILLNGQPFPPMPTEGYQHRSRLIVEVNPPELVQIAGMWGLGTDKLDELLVEFDRPVTVNNFKLYDKSGDVVDGEYFTSIFQMAVVLLPKDSTLLLEGTLLRAEWDVVDTLGRSNSGSTTLPLRRYEH